MRAYGIYEAKTKLPDLIRQVQQGERITITNRGEPVVDLIPSTHKTAQQTLDAIQALKNRRATNSSITQKQFNDMRQQGRR